MVFIVSAMSKPRRPGSNVGFFSRQKARIDANPLRIAGVTTSSERTRSPTPQAPAVEAGKAHTSTGSGERMDVWPKYRAYLTQDACDYYKERDLSEILNDSGAHALKVKT